MTDKTKTAEAALDARAADLDRRERDLRRAGHVAFAEALVAEGRLLPAQKDKVVGLLDFVAASEQPFEFADGGKTVAAAPADLFRDILKAQPKIVSFGAHDLGEEGGAAPVDFAAPEGMQVDPASLDLHRRAIAHQSQNAGMSYAAAVAAVNR